MTQSAGELPEAGSRAHKFAAGLGRIPRVDPVDLRRTWQLVVGATLVGVGAAAILLAYIGAGRMVYVEEQIPYLISGGLLGLGLMIVGGFFFWGHWLYRQYERNELHNARLLEAVRDLTNAMQARTGTPTPPAPSFSAAPVRRARSVRIGGASELVMTARGTVVHRPDCASVASAVSRSISASDVARSGYKPCRLCEPQI